MRFERPNPRPCSVELCCEGRLLERVYGRRGNPGHHRSQLFDTPAEAVRAWRGQVSRLEHKGYRAGTHHAALLQAICATPDDRAPYLVYADWLLGQHDPRGELIMRMVGRGAFDTLLEAHPTQLQPAWWSTAGITVSWRWGFVQRAVVDPAFDLGTLRRLLRHPSLSVLRELVLRRPAALDWPFALENRPSTLERIEVHGAVARARLLDSVRGRGLGQYELDRLEELRPLVPAVLIS